MASLTNFALSLHNHTSKTPEFSEFINFKNPKIIYSSSPVIIHTRLRHPVRKPYISPVPIPKQSIAAFLSSPKEETSNFLVSKFASVLLGSLIFISCSKSRPVLAEPFRESVILEERGSQLDKGRKIEEVDDEETMCVKLLQQNPKSIEALKMAVNVKMKKGKTSESVQYVEKLIALQPHEMEWRLLQALCYEMMGDLRKAKSLFVSILKQKPLLLKALHGLAMVMHKNKEGLAVFEMLETALEVARREKRVDEERNIRILIAQMHTLKGNLKEAMEDFQGLIEENPRDFRPYLCQGIVYILLEKTKEAEENFKIYRSLVPDEFPQRGFLDDVVLAAKTDLNRQFEKKP